MITTPRRGGGGGGGAIASDDPGDFQDPFGGAGVSNEGGTWGSERVTACASLTEDAFVPPAVEPGMRDESGPTAQDHAQEPAETSRDHHPGRGRPTSYGRGSDPSKNLPPLELGSQLPNRPGNDSDPAGAGRRNRTD